MKYIIASIIMILCSVFYFSTSEYSQYRERNLEILQTYSGLAAGRRVRTEFIFVMKTENGEIFDRRVTPSTYYRFGVGDKITMNLRDFDIKQTGDGNIMNFFFIFLCSVGIVVAGIGFFEIFDKRVNR